MILVMVVENHEADRLLIKEWIETQIRTPGLQVVAFDHPVAAERVLKEYVSQGVIGCLVLDMFYQSPLGDRHQVPQGDELLRRYSQIPIILISARAESRDWKRNRPDVPDDVPLIHLDKPNNLFPAGPGIQRDVDDFQRDLLEAVRCGLEVGSLRLELARLEGGQLWGGIGKFKGFKAWKAGLLFLAALLAYTISYWIAKDELLQHITLALCAVTGVHLLDRSVLLSDFRDVFEGVSKRLVELSVEIQKSAEGRSVKKRPKKSTENSGSATGEQPP